MTSQRFSLQLFSHFWRDEVEWMTMIRGPKMDHFRGILAIFGHFWPEK